jgi:hypothetical protein
LFRSSTNDDQGKVWDFGAGRCCCSLAVVDYSGTRDA